MDVRRKPAFLNIFKRLLARGRVFAVTLNATHMNTSSRHRIGRRVVVGTGFHGSTGRDEAL